MRKRAEKRTVLFRIVPNSAQRTKEESEMLKDSIKGITLVALVVTIIVLLILAGIAMNLIIGDNGIISRAKKCY